MRADASGSLSAGPSEIECRHAEQSFSLGFLLLLATYFFMVFVAWVFLSSSSRPMADVSETCLSHVSVPSTVR